MARIKLEEIINHLSYDIKRAFTNTIKKEFPELKFDEKTLFKSFAENIGKESKKWEQVPDDAVEKGDY